jgi:hypothetical protein
LETRIWFSRAPADASGKQISEARIELPSLERIRTQPADPTASEATLITRMLPVTNGRFLVEWRHLEAAGNAQRAARFMTLHDRTGKALTTATYPAPRTSVLFSDAPGNAYLLRVLDSGVQEHHRGCGT